MPQPVDVGMVPYDVANRAAARVMSVVASTVVRTRVVRVSRAARRAARDGGRARRSAQVEGFG